MKTFIFTISVLLAACVYAETWQGGWRDCAKSQVGRADMRQYRNVDFWHQAKPKDRFSFELGEANLVFNNTCEYINCGFVVYDVNIQKAIMASRFLIRKNEDPKIKGKFKVTLVDIKYRDARALEECDEVIKKMEDAAKRQCAELFMSLIKRGIAKDKKQAELLAALAKAAEEKAKAKTAAEVKAESNKPEEDVKTPSSSISSVF